MIPNSLHCGSCYFYQMNYFALQKMPSYKSYITSYELSGIFIYSFYSGRQDPKERGTEESEEVARTALRSLKKRLKIQIKASYFSLRFDPALGFDLKLGCNDGFTFSTHLCVLSSFFTRSKLIRIMITQTEHGRALF